MTAGGTSLGGHGAPKGPAGQGPQNNPEGSFVFAAPGLDALDRPR